MRRTNIDLKEDYTHRLSRVFSFIEKNLDADLSLKIVAARAHFSEYHFHRVFKFVTGETLNEYVTRKRIERAALDLVHRKNTIKTTAFKFGFSSMSSFSKTFKKIYGISPKEFQFQNPNKFSKIRQLESKIGQAYPDIEKYICIINNIKNWIIMKADIQIKEFSDLNLACVSCTGPQNLGLAYQKILLWATPKNLMSEDSKMVTIYHDSFKVTEPDKIRMSACLLLEKPTETSHQIHEKNIERGKYIVGHFRIKMNEFEKSWTGLFIWMNENGYQKADKDPFEIYYNNPNEHPDKKAIVDFCIPIV